MPKAAAKDQDEATRLIYAELEKAFPNLPDDPALVVYRYNPVSIRVRVIDSRFAGKGMAARERMVNRALKNIPEETLADITLLLMLTPEEAGEPGQLMNLEFDDPTGARL